MSSGLALRYDPIEDRLVLTCTSRDGDVQVLHLTRRFTRLFTRRLATIAAKTAEAPAGGDRGQRESLAALHHDAQAARVAIEEARAPKRGDDPGPRPLLVTRVRTGRTGGQRDRWIVEFRGEDGPPVRITLSVRLLHGFIELIRRKLPSTGWDIELLADPVDQSHRRLMH